VRKPMPPQTTAAPEIAIQTQRLADELRRVVHQLALTRPSAPELAAAADAASSFADRLEALPVRRTPGVVSEAALSPGKYAGYSPVHGEANVLAPPLRLRVVGAGHERRVEGSVTFGPAYEGPPGHVHGGYVAAAFDELLGWAQLQPGFTGTLTVRYRRPTPLGRELRMEAALERVEGRKRWVRGTLHLGDVLLCEAEGLFIGPRGGDYAAALGLAGDGGPG